MSYTIDGATGHIPVVGEDIAITAPALGGKVIVLSHEFETSRDPQVGLNGIGDTVFRIWRDIEQAKGMTLDLLVIGADEATAATNNDPYTTLKPGTQVTTTSSKHPAAAGNWRVNSTRQSGSNEGNATWSVVLVPEIP